MSATPGPLAANGKRMRIALSSADVNKVGGAERVAVEAANWLAIAGHEVTVYGVRIDREVLEDTVRVHQISVPAKLDVYTGFGFRTRAAAAIAADGPDVHGAFCGLSPLGGVFWVPVVSRVGYNLLLSRRSAFARVPVQLNPFHRGRLWLERGLLAPGGCARLLALTDQSRSDIASIYGVPAADIEVLAPGFDPDVFDPERRSRRRAEARARFGYEDEDRVLLFVGNELERKGFDTLLEAVGLLGDPKVKVLGAGHIAPDAGQYRSLIERLGLAERLQWLGSSSDVALLHAAADVFALPTRYEPWGLVIVEALGSGLPVVASQLAGAALAVDETQTGKLLQDPESPGELAEALRWALSGAPAEAQVIAASVRDYTWPRVIARYELVLRAVATEQS